MKLDYSLTKILDVHIRDTFQTIKDFFAKQNHLFGFRHYEITFNQAETGFLFTHRLGFIPRDVIITSVVGSGSASVNYSDSTINHVSFTTTGPCVVRFFLGTYGG